MKCDNCVWEPEGYRVYPLPMRCWACGGPLQALVMPSTPWGQHLEGEAYLPGTDEIVGGYVYTTRRRTEVYDHGSLSTGWQFIPGADFTSLSEIELRSRGMEGIIKKDPASGRWFGAPHMGPWAEQFNCAGMYQNPRWSRAMELWRSGVVDYDDIRRAQRRLSWPSPDWCASQDQIKAFAMALDLIVAEREEATE